MKSFRCVFPGTNCSKFMLLQRKGSQLCLKCHQEQLKWKFANLKDIQKLVWTICSILTTVIGFILCKHIHLATSQKSQVRKTKNPQMTRILQISFRQKYQQFIFIFFNKWLVDLFDDAISILYLLRNYVEFSICLC